MNIPAAEGQILLVNKPLKWTSFDVVKKVKGIISAKKAGHAGTLDPLATGLLILCTEKKTKSIQEIQDAEKEYTGTFYIGATTPSFDLETERDAESDISHLGVSDVQSAFLHFTGEIMQIPPMHSAVKTGGQRAYKLARRGESVELKARSLVIREFEVTRCDLPEVDFRVVCSKGTYIRSLARDVGQYLGVGAHLVKLCRTRIGPYFLTNAQTISEIEAKYAHTKALDSAKNS